jgi:hypothetical protein
MNEPTQLESVKTRLGELLVELQLLARRWTIDADRRVLERWLSWILRCATDLLVDVDEPIEVRDQRIAKAVHDAYLPVLLLALQLIPKLEEQQRRRTELPSTTPVSDAISALLDLLDPLRRRADAILGHDVLVTLQSYNEAKKTRPTAV